jgi:hypothetical protein
MSHHDGFSLEQRASSVEARWLSLILAGVGMLDALAAVAVFAPYKWLTGAHFALGLGDLPNLPVVNYLARSASAKYAVFGAFMIFLSRDVGRYWPLVGFLIWASLIHGAVIVGIDLLAELPHWWPIGEGLGYFIPGVLMLVLYRKAEQRRM